MELQYPHLEFYTSLEHHPRGYILKNLMQGGVGLEIGVWQGGFAEMLLHWTKPKELHLIDPWENVDTDGYEGAFYHNSHGNDMNEAYEFVRHRFAKEVADERVFIHRARSADIAHQFKDESFDWVYVDGDHSYEGIKSDLDLYIPKVKPGGYIVGDDYTNIDEWWGDGIFRAVYETILSGTVKWSSSIGGCFVLEKP
jgi:hypothetical protein